MAEFTSSGGEENVPLRSGDGSITTYAVQRVSSKTDLVNLSGSGVLLGGYAVINTGTANTFQILEITSDGKTERYDGLWKGNDTDSAQLGVFCSIPTLEFSDGLQIRTQNLSNNCWATCQVRQ